jgi:hypothetical protein
MNIARFARPIPTTATSSSLPCVGTPAVNTRQPVQMMYQNLWDAYYTTEISYRTRRNHELGKVS